MIHIKSFVHIWRYVDIHKSFHHSILMSHLNRGGTFNLEYAIHIFYIRAYGVYADICISGKPHMHASKCASLKTIARIANSIHVTL